MLDPETLLIIGIIGGIGAAATYASFMLAEKAGPALEPGDLLPALPPHPPLPRFLYKPEALELLRKK